MHLKIKILHSAIIYLENGCHLAEERRKILRCCNWRSSTKRLETSMSKSATRKMKIRCHENQFRRFRRTMKRPSSVNCCCWMKSSPTTKRGEVCWRNCIADDATIHKDATTGTTSATTTDAAKSTTKSTETATAVQSNRRNNSTGGDGSTNADGDASGVAAASKRIAARPETSLLVADRMAKSGKSTGC